MGSDKRKPLETCELEKKYISIDVIIYLKVYVKGQSIQTIKYLSEITEY